MFYIVLAAAGSLVAGLVLRAVGAGAPAWAGSLASLLVTVASFVPPVLVAGRRERRAGLRLPMGRGRIPIAVLLPLFLGAMVAVNSLASLLRGALVQAWELPEASAALLPEDGRARLFYFLLVCVAAPVLEDLFFRGVLQRALRPYGVGLAILLSAVLFMLAHANLWELPTVFVLGAIIGYVAEVSGSLLPGIVLHAANNLAMFLILLQRQRLSGMASLAFVFWMVLLFVALFVAGLWAVHRFRLLPLFRLRQRKTGRKRLRQHSPERIRGKRPGRAALGDLLGQPAFAAGAVAMVAYCIIRLFSG